MAVRALTVTVEARDPAGLAQFWSAVLGRELVQDARGAHLPASGTAPGLRFVPGPAVQPSGRHWLHLHLTSDTLEDQQEQVATVLRLGGSHLDVGQRTEEGHVVLADPEGNEFCIIEPDNAFLAGCGLLGELACDGTREVGHFWSRALGWPLVWDRDGETAVQSPQGGTKVAWSGTAAAARTDCSSPRFELEPSDAGQQAEVDRLVDLGATRLPGGEPGLAVLADPDGNPFCVNGVPACGSGAGGEGR